jgi:lysophospholipase L1-like esterase
VTGRRPLRVAVLGNSVPLLVVPSRAHRDDGTYVERLEALLAEADVPATLTNRSRLFELIHEGARRFPQEIAPLQPDVLIVNYGILELQPNVLPTTINRHLSRTAPGGRGVRRLWRRFAIPRLWPVARSWQQWASARVGMRTWRLRPDLFVAELAHIVRDARSSKMLVLVLDVHEPGPRLDHFMPGIGERWVRFQEVVRHYVTTLDDPDVRLVEVSAVVEGLGEVELGDGLHLTAKAHAQLADDLVREILEFLDAGNTTGLP